MVFKSGFEKVQRRGIVKVEYEREFQSVGVAKLKWRVGNGEQDRV